MIPLTPAQENQLAEARTAHVHSRGTPSAELSAMHDRANLIAMVDRLRSQQPSERSWPVFVDVETTGLDPDLHEIWEVALIDPTGDRGPVEKVWQLPVDLGHADPASLAISHFHDRHGRQGTQVNNLRQFAAEFARATRGRHLVGAVPSFDDKRLERLLRANGALPEWHYHLIDVEALAVGWVCGRFPELNTSLDPAAQIKLPWSSRELTLSLGLPMPSDEDRHTALGDARWAMAIWDHVMTNGASSVVDAEIVDDVARAAAHYAGEPVGTMAAAPPWADELEEVRATRLCDRCHHAQTLHRLDIPWTANPSLHAGGVVRASQCPDCIDCEPF